jgi:trimeric autotransporter adhesin
VDAVADFTGTAADDTFTARATNATTGVAATTVNDGDTLDGGAGKDTLNITSTADNNRSLTGLATSNIETINIAGANNLGTLTTASAAPTAGAAQVQVLDIAAARNMGEVQTIDFGTVAVRTAVGTITIAGKEVALAIGDTPQSIAGKVKTALESITGGEISSVTQAGSKLTVLFAPTSAATATKGADADPSDTRLNVTGDLTISGVKTVDYAASDAVTVNINGVDYATAAISTPAGLGRSAVAAPVAPTVATVQGLATVGSASAVDETGTVTFADYVSGAAATYTVAGRTLTIAEGSANITGANIASAFASGTAPTGGTFSGTLTGFTAGSASSATLTYTSATAGTNVADLAASGGATVTARTQGSAAVTAVTATSEVSTITFTDLAIGQSVTVAGRKVTAETSSLTATQVAALMAGGSTSGTGAVVDSTNLAGFTIAATSPASTSVKATASSAGAATDVVVSVAGLTAADILAATNAHANTTRDAVKAVVDRVLGGAVTAVAGDDAGELKLTSNSVGTALPTITVSQGTASRSSVDTGDTAAVANAVRSQVAAAKQVVTFTVEDGGDGSTGTGQAALNNFGAGSAFELFVNGASVGKSTITLTSGAASEAQVATQLAAAINAALGSPTVPVAVAVGGVVTVTAPVAGTSLPILSVNLTKTTVVGTTTLDTGEAITFNEFAANAQVVAQVVSAGTASVNAAQFVGAELVNLSGTSGSTTVTGVTAGQTIGFTDVTMANTVAFGALTSGSVAVNASAGTLTTTGNALTTLALSGTGTSGLAITDGGSTALLQDPITTLNLSTSGSTVLDTASMGSLATLTQTGAGGVTLTPGTTLASITTGAGADTLRVSTATALDNPGTTTNEAVNALVSTGAGSDRLVITTTGAGTTTVDAGAGDDTLFVTGLSTGQNSLSGGDGNDAFRITAGSGLIAGLQNVTINGGAGTDTLRVSNTTFAASDYTILSANVSSVETLELAGVVTALDASKVSATGLRFLASGSAVTEVGSGQAVTLARTAAATATTGFSETGATLATPGSITVSSKGFILDNDATVAGRQSVFGDNLGVTLTNTATATSVAANGNALTLGVVALGSTATVTAGASPVATVTGELTSINVALQSARGSGTVAATENVAGFVASVSTDNLDNVTSITVTGSGTANITAGTIAAVDAKLTTINVSGMTAFADQDIVGNLKDGVFTNLSTTTITLNNNVAETVLLGGAKDTVATGSTIVARDVVTGFQVTAAADGLTVDTTRSDVLKIGTAFDSSATVGAANYAAKMTVTGSTLEAALLQAAGLKGGALGTTDIDKVVFNFGGNTYVYVDTGANGLTDNDQLVQLSGTLNLDLLLQSGVIIA